MENNTSVVKGVTRLVVKEAVSFLGTDTRKYAVLTVPKTGNNRPFVSVRFWLTVQDALTEKWENSFSLSYHKAKMAEADAYRWAICSHSFLLLDNGGKTADRYSIRIGESWYGMSYDADRANGYCQYIGEAGEHRTCCSIHYSPRLGHKDHQGDKQIPIGDLSTGATYQLMYLLRWEFPLLIDIRDNCPELETFIGPKGKEAREEWESFLGSNLEGLGGIYYRLDSGRNPTAIYGYDREHPFTDFIPVTLIG